MKKLSIIVLLCVLIGSFLVGALANAEPRPGQGIKNCVLGKLICDYDTCILYQWYYCHWGEFVVEVGMCCCPIPTDGGQ